MQPLRERLPLVESAMELAALRGEEPPPPHDAAFVEIAVAAQADVFLVRAFSSLGSALLTRLLVAFTTSACPFHAALRRVSHPALEDRIVPPWSTPAQGSFGQRERQRQSPRLVGLLRPAPPPFPTCCELSTLHLV